jgi:F-type H+-transporting ATPase subunit delta
VNINATLFVQMAVFAALWWFTAKYVWPPIVKSLDERSRRIADGLAAADKAKADLAAAEKRVQAEIGAARASATEVRANAEKAAAHMLEEARAEATRIVAEARRGRRGRGGPRRAARQGRAARAGRDAGGHRRRADPASRDRRDPPRRTPRRPAGRATLRIGPMAESLTIARPYAEAAFKLARDAGALQPWSAALARLVSVVRTDPARELIGNPRTTDAQVAALIADVAGDLLPEQRSFVQVLAANERLAVLPEIAEVYEHLRNAHEGLLDARISSAFPLGDSQVEQIAATLEAKYGRKVKPSVTVDPDLIGGISIRIGDEVMDASVRGKLAQLADALMH